MQKWPWLKPHGSVDCPRVNRHGLKFFGNFSEVLHYGLLEKGITVSSGRYICQLAHVSDKHSSHYGRTAKGYMPVLLHDNALLPPKVTSLA